MTKINMKTLTIKQEDRNPNSTESIAYRLNYIIRKRRYTAKEVASLTEDKTRGLKPISPATINLYINGKKRAKSLIHTKTCTSIERRPKLVVLRLTIRLDQQGQTNT